MGFLHRDYTPGIRTYVIVFSIQNGFGFFRNIVDSYITNFVEDRWDAMLKYYLFGFLAVSQRTMRTNSVT